MCLLEDNDYPLSATFILGLAEQCAWHGCPNCDALLRREGQPPQRRPNPDSETASLNQAIDRELSQMRRQIEALQRRSPPPVPKPKSPRQPPTRSEDGIGF